MGGHFGETEFGGEIVGAVGGPEIFHIVGSEGVLSFGRDHGDVGGG